MTDTPSPMAKQSLLTFALFAYNQEKYIRQAIEGAFSQTYEPLEIILSDDCSSDGTFEIMQEMAEAYKGPHKVKVRRNPVNYGLINHVNTVISKGTSQIIVLAAGDDISQPERTASIANKFQEQPACQLIHSAVFEVDADGKTLGHRSPDLREGPYDLPMLAISSSIYIGATGAIRKTLVDYFGPIKENETYEDLTYGFRAALLDGLSYIDDPLVFYRKNIGISSKFKRENSNRKKIRVALHKHRLATLRQRKSDALKINGKNLRGILDAIDAEVTIAEYRAFYHESLWSFIKGFSRKDFFIQLRVFASETKHSLGMFN